MNELLSYSHDRYIRGKILEYALAESEQVATIGSRVCSFIMQYIPDIASAQEPCDVVTDTRM